MAAGVKGDLRTFNVAVNAAFKTALQGRTASQGGQIATIVPMSTKRVEFPIAGNVGPMREWKGSRIIKSIIRDSYEIVTKKFEKTIAIGVEEVEDDNLDIYMPAINQLSYQVSVWQDQQIFKALEAGTVGKGYDRVAYFGTHVENGVNVSNLYDAAGSDPAWYIFDTARPIKPVLFGDRVAPKITPKTAPTDDNVFDRDELLWGARARGGAGYGLWQAAYRVKAPLNAANYEAAITAMRLRKDDEGESLDINPNLVLVPPQLQWDAQRLWGRNILPNGEENIHQADIKFQVVNRLTGA